LEFQDLHSENQIQVNNLDKVALAIARKLRRVPGGKSREACDDFASQQFIPGCLELGCE
jgi:hypothetical protein